MKKAIFRILSVIMALCVFLGVMPVTVFAEKTENNGLQLKDYRHEGEILTNFDPSVDVSVSRPPIYSNQFFSTGADDMYYFYTYLNANQKAVYDAVKAVNAQPNVEINATLATPMQFITTVDSNNYLIIPDEVWDIIGEYVIGGISALSDDYPEYFWIYGCSSYGLGSDWTYSYNSDGTFTITVNSIDLIIALNEEVYADATVVENYYAELKNAVSEFKVNGITRYEKVKSIHDTIVRQVQYDPNYNNTSKNPTDHEPISVFTEPYLTVCEGYAEAFKLICDREGIPCVIVVGDAGGGHAWNYVKMEDGKWYAFDMTWDDPLGNSTENVYYDYFLVGSTAPGTSSQTFSDEHTPTGVHYLNVNFSLTYPVLSETSYSKVFSRVNSTGNVREGKKLLYIDKGATFSNSFSAPYGQTISTSGTTTGGTLTVKSGSTVVSTYTLVRRGDVDKSNSVNSTDYNIIVEAAQCVGATPTNNTAEFYAADMNHDGAIDGFDAIVWDLYQNGELEYN